MSVKFQLKKDAYMKKGAVGFSYTTYFWEFFVPIFRGDGKGLLMLFIARILLLSPGYLINYFFRNFIFNPNSLLTKILTPLLDIKYKYIVICYYLFLGLILIITTLVWLYIGNWYNKNYTVRLLNKGYSPLENDDYALALLKGYGYLEYTEEEKEDKEKMELYKNIVETVKKDEKSKYYIFLVYFIITFIIVIIIYYSEISRIGDMTYLEAIQAANF
ncbi:hypothetical protein CJ209_07985 [Fusobacterium nucleatum]|uniref:HrgC protein n=2 Tax=Fusobacterium TaxID=848 RepID=D6BEQ0_9FUSO|nr:MULTISPECIES: hypothetical protein [Fusobacterium]EFD80647.2 hypothetical protein PSAG_00682 [Fusobacterium animalis D11]ALF22308.1 hypothetical protein RO08_08335 [Fusobacterium animalis]ERT38506.1 hypothetical protein HMPREF1766_00420 [Fusobacterium nucleatum CTI-5]ERT42347.1 hypothetical protein HMPREF1538_00377 [Fusobacterium nucleatum CTI-1]MCL4584328.1 hypothetical protein [Fusobacterium nucleatum YWH7055]